MNQLGNCITLCGIQEQSETPLRLAVSIAPAFFVRTPSVALLFLLTIERRVVMEFLPVILTFVAAYGLFLFLAYVLARVFFPTIDLQDDEMRPKRIRTRQPKRLVGH